MTRERQSENQPSEAAPVDTSLKGRFRDLWDDLKSNGGGPAMEWRTLFVIISIPILLTVFYYYGQPKYYRTNLLDWANETFGPNWDYHELAPYGYWAAGSLIIRVLLPLIIIVAVLRERPGEFGFKLAGSWRHLPIYLGLLAFMLPLLYWASTQASFQDKYPFYSRAGEMGVHFWAYECLYFIQFFSLEAFFRGYIIFGLRKQFGYYSVLIMCIPYCMIHFNKPITETLGAIVAGAVLGILALRSGSFYLGVILHFGVAITMDLLALWQAGAL